MIIFFSAVLLITDRGQRRGFSSKLRAKPRLFSYEFLVLWPVYIPGIKDFGDFSAMILAEASPH